MMTIFWIACALAGLATLAAWIADYRSAPADKREDAGFLEIKAAIGRWDEACEQARIRLGSTTLDRESDAASDRLWELMRPQMATRDFGGDTGR
jgi:hypothetical protein